MPAHKRPARDPETILLAAIVGAALGSLVTVSADGSFAWEDFLITYAVSATAVTVIWWLWARFFRS